MPSSVNEKMDISFKICTNEYIVPSSHFMTTCANMYKKYTGVKQPTSTVSATVQLMMLAGF